MENTEGLSKKEQGRVKAVLTQSRLGIFDTKDKMNSQRNNISICQSLDRCTHDTQKILDTFLCSSDSNPMLIKLFRTINSEGIGNIAQICNSTESIRDTSIRTIFGGTEHMPFRGLAYLLPALNLCEQLQERGIANSDLPNIEYFFMNGAGFMANDLDPERTYRTSFQFMQIARKYIQEFHPTLDKNVNFYMDRSFTTKIMKTPEYKQIYKIFETKLEENTELRGDLEEMGERRKAAVNSIKYATLHIFSQDGYINPEVAQMYDFERGRSLPEVSSIISIGARPEETFFGARQTLVNSMSGVSFFTPKKTAQYIANFNVPPYSPLPEGELYLDDTVRNPELVNEARLRSKDSEEYSKYQMPVQKAVEMLIADTENSSSEKNLVDFMKGISKEKERD